MDAQDDPPPRTIKWREVWPTGEARDQRLEPLIADGCSKVKRSASPLTLVCRLTLGYPPTGTRERPIRPRIAPVVYNATRIQVIFLGLGQKRLRHVLPVCSRGKGSAFDSREGLRGLSAALQCGL